MNNIYFPGDPGYNSSDEESDDNDDDNSDDDYTGPAWEYGEITPDPPKLTKEEFEEVCRLEYLETMASIAIMEENAKKVYRLEDINWAIDKNVICSAHTGWKKEKSIFEKIYIERGIQLNTDPKNWDFLEEDFDDPINMKFVTETLAKGEDYLKDWIKEDHSEYIKELEGRNIIVPEILRINTEKVLMKENELM
jgi:hypothetical protein